MLTAQHARSPERLDAMIKHCATLTDKPFGVNLTIFGEKRAGPDADPMDLLPRDFCEVLAANSDRCDLPSLCSHPARFAQPVALLLGDSVKIMETCGGDPTLMAELNRVLRAGGVEVVRSQAMLPYTLYTSHPALERSFLRDCL